MVQYQRITTDGSDISWLKELETRVSRLETPATGDVAVRGLFTATDPITGVQTQFGSLPDGNTGFKQYVYDITPPPVATAPVAKAEPGVFIIAWDGLFASGESTPDDFECCNIIAHKIENGATVFSTPVGMTRRPLDITFVQTDIAGINETWNFSLEAEDFNGNRAEWSARSNTVTMLPVAAEVDLTEIEAEIQQAKDDASAAQTAAASASSEAAAASQQALAALNAANGAIRTWYTPEAPTGLNNTTDVGDLWFDADNGQASRWTGDQWVMIEDNDIAVALGAAQDAQDLAETKSTVFRQTTQPTTGKIGDVWFDSDDKNKPYYCTSISPLTWTEIRDGAIVDAANLAASKGKVIIQSSTPVAADQLPQNMWIDTTNGNNTPKRWDAGTSQWVVVTDKIATDAAAAVVIAKQRADEAFNNAATAAESAGNAQTTANSKNRVWYVPTAPAGTAHRHDDIWFDTDDDNKIYRWNTSLVPAAWEPQLIGNSAILGNLDAGKISVGFIKAAVLAAKSITVDKLVISSSDNMAVEADINNNGSSWGQTNGLVYNATGGRAGDGVLRATGSSGTKSSKNLLNRFTVSPEARFRGNLIVKATEALAAGAVQLILHYYTSTSPNTSTSIFIANSPAIVANTWTTIEGVSGVLPTNTIAGEIVVAVVSPNATVVVDIDYVSVTRAADGKMIVDGALDAKTITGPYIQTDNSVDAVGTGRGLKLNPLGFKAYNALGQKTFEIAASTGTVTATGTYSSGTTSEEGAAGKTVRVTMGIINFQNWQNSPGLMFESHNTADASTTPSGFMFYYFGGIQIRSTTPSTVWTQFRNDSYVWVAQDGVQIVSGNSGRTQIPLDVANRSNFETRTTPGTVEKPANDSHLRISTFTYPNATKEGSYGALLRTYTDASAPRGILTLGNYAYNVNAQVYEARGQASFEYDGTTRIGVYDSLTTVRSQMVMLGSSYGVDAYAIAMYADKIDLTGGSNAISTGVTTRAKLALNDTGGFLYGPGRNNWFFATSDVVGMSGKVQINGTVDVKMRHAEFITLDWYVAGNNTSWDTGWMSADTGRTTNNDFCRPHPTIPGAIEILRAGYYQVGLRSFPRSNPGSGWYKLNHQGTSLLSMDMITEGRKHEAVLLTPFFWFAAGDHIRSQVAMSLEHRIDCRWTITGSILNF